MRPRRGGWPAPRRLPQRLTRLALPGLRLGSGLAALLVLGPAAVAAQTTGTILGRVLDARSDAPLEGAQVTVLRADLRTLTAADGRFVLAAVPVGERSVRIELLGYRAVTLESVPVRAGRATELSVELTPQAFELAGVVVEAQRVRLIEPEATVSRETVVGRELRELPIDAVAEAVELTPGVSGGHFRGGRIGQESYVVDGFEVKNQLEASSQGLGLEFSATALEEIEVVTGGFGAEFGSALSGVVRYATRRGNPESWEGRASFTTDHGAPTSLSRGFTALSASAGGPVPALGAGTTLFADVLLHGQLDAKPRARGLTCVRAGDADPLLAEEIRALEAHPAARRLHCPYTSPMFPHQRGDKLIGFVRLDRPVGRGAAITVSLLRNRLQRELYTPEFKYNSRYQLGERSTGTLANLTVDWTRHARGHAYHLTLQSAAMRLDRHLGALDRQVLDGQFRIAGFSFSDYRFLGEEFVRAPIEDQLAAAAAVPGYAAPGGAGGSPFGPAAEGIFFTEGTPHLANWTRTDLVGGSVAGEVLSARGHSVRAGASVKLYRVESYERILSYLPGSSPSYARFFPATLSAFAEARLAAADNVTVSLGGRVDAFRSGLGFPADRADFSSPVIQTEWRWVLMPRIGAAFPLDGGRSVIRVNYGLVAQPPDFRFFLDTTIGDSLRTDIRRQGNPALAFERGNAYEVGFGRLFGESLGLELAVFRKELVNLVTGSLTFAGGTPGQFTMGDFGTVQGLEVRARARWPLFELRGGYALQKATGVTSGALSDTILGAERARVEFPLAFDRRHSADLAVLGGRMAGSRGLRWGTAVVASVRSGYPIDRDRGAAAGIGSPGDAPRLAAMRLPWTATVDLRVSYDLGSPPGCRRCALLLLLDGRNVLGRENVLGVRRSSGTPAPTLEEVRSLAGSRAAPPEPIPRESPRYSGFADLDGDGLITPEEYRTARFAAALDRLDPSLFYGEARQVRLGVEVVF